MPTTTPLTDAINALTTYANTVTGGSDTDLSAAVATLAAGYGGGGYEAKFLELKAIIEGTTTSIDNSTITKWSAGTIYQRNTVTKHVWREWVDRAPNQFFRGASAMTLCVFPKLVATGNDMFWNCTNLAVADFGALSTNVGFDNYTFENCSALTTLILRPDHVVNLTNTNVFNGTPYKSGGTGGVIYVPQAQIANYQSATNWSTVHGWGTITWQAIEGSQYENYYADGTPIE